MTGLLAQGGFLSDIAALVTAIAGLIAAIVAGWKFLDERRKRKEAEVHQKEAEQREQAAEEREKEAEAKNAVLVEAMASLHASIADLQAPSQVEENRVDPKLAEQLVAAVNQLASAVKQLQRDVEDLKKRGSGSSATIPPPPLVPPPPPLVPPPTVVSSTARPVLRGKFPQLCLRVSPAEAIRRLNEIPHNKCTGMIATKWRSDPSGRVPYQSVNWLFCWGKTGMSSPEAAEEARRVFDDVLDMPFAEYDAQVDHEDARSNRG